MGYNDINLFLTTCKLQTYLLVSAFLIAFSNNFFFKMLMFKNCNLCNLGK